MSETISGTLIKRSRVDNLVLCVALAAVYFFAGKIGLSLATVHRSATVVWPPSGIALVAVLLLGRQVWPGIFLGAFLVNLTTAGNVATSLAIAGGNTLEPIVGAYLAGRFAGGERIFDHARQIFRFVLFTAVSTMISPTLGLTGLCLGGFAAWADFSGIWSTWWLGDWVSCLCVAPLILVWTRRQAVRLTFRQLAEALALMVLLVFVCGVIFSGLFVSGSQNQPLSYLAIPFVLWSAFRFGRRGTIVVCTVISVMAVRGTLHQLGPFVGLLPADESLVLVQLYVGTITVMGLVLASVIKECKDSIAAQQTVNEQLKVEIQERQKAQAALAAHTQQLTRSNSDLENFAHIASHDLQEPLRKIISFGDRLLQSDPLSADQKDCCERMQNAAYRMRRLIEDVFKFARLSSEEALFENVDLKNVLGGVLTDLDLAVQESRASIEVEGLPEVYGNAAQLGHVFQNLISNAIKFRQPNVRPVIRISGVVRSGTATIVVEDNGIGFNPVYANQIFGPFKRLHGREYEGTGLGLAICHRIVQFHSGRIEASGQPEKGARFTMELPAGRA